MEGPRVTIIVTPRERFSLARRSLESVFANTDEDFAMIYVDVASPPSLRRYLEREAAKRGFRLIRVNELISPNHARNIGIAEADSEYVVLLDNDVLVQSGWLAHLLGCADETGAWAVGPLYLEGEFEEGRIHMAGGDLEFSGEWGSRRCLQTQRYFQHRLSQVPVAFEREPCQLVEFHCALVRRDAFAKAGRMDEQLLTTREHMDFCQRIMDAGGSIYFEPKSVITYCPPPPFEFSDLAYFMLRWSDQWTLWTLRHFSEKYGLDHSYAERVAKTRQRRQLLLFRRPLAHVERVLGHTAARGVGRMAAALEPALNRLAVKLLTPSQYRPEKP